MVGELKEFCIHFYPLMYTLHPYLGYSLYSLSTTLCSQLHLIPNKHGVNCVSRVVSAHITSSYGTIVSRDYKLVFKHFNSTYPSAITS
ncbi:hypothetical protein EYC84_006373 [Monilinia fructicola]|uniref:Uncharacterized protein n=1 Tax=Monilinia fructicola TaxID=38448 RepID=A0A5M9K819_MONFR|nr:hypothetical protein EYC84_006373 [Monilinia fructicola]